MGCCCGVPVQEDRESRSTRRSLDLEAQEQKPETEDGVPSGKEADLSSEEMKEEESNIVTDTLGHLVGPDSARNSLAMPRDVPQDSFRTAFACVQFQFTDRITLIDFPTKYVSLVYEAIPRYWPKGIQREESDGSRSHSFKLKGNPWMGQWDDAVSSRRLAKGLIEELYNAGWVLNLASSVSHSCGNDKDALIFRHQDPPPAKCDWMGISFLQLGPTHKIELIDAPSDVIQIMADALTPMCSKHAEVSGSRVHEFELKNNPFASARDKTLPQELMLVLLPALERCGFTVSAAIDQIDGAWRPDTWYCCRTVGWTPGLPVFHR